MPARSYDWGSYLENRDDPGALLRLITSGASPQPAGGIEAPATKTVRPKQSSGGGKGGQALSWAKRQLGTKEGSGRQRYYASRFGLSAGLPWCSIFVANALRNAGVKKVPSNLAYSGAWMNWKGGRRVKTSQIRPGDIVIYDWGDGGITDHVAIYEGRGKVIGGNQSNAVTRAGARLGQAVAVIRPK